MATKMTTEQRQYAVRRIRDISNEMKAAVAKKYVLDNPQELTIGNLVTLILKGIVKPRKENAALVFGSGYQNASGLKEAFEIVDPSPYYRTSPVRDEKKWKAANNKIEEKTTQLTDKLMLSDAAAALKLVEDFANEAEDFTKIKEGERASERAMRETKGGKKRSKASR